MGDMHVRVGNRKDDKYLVVFHFPVSPGNNSAGAPWQDILASTNPTTQLTEGTEAWEITTAEKLEVEAGTLVEWPVPIDLEPGRDTAAKVTRALQHHYPRERTKMQQEMGRRYRWYGMTESEA